MVVTKDELIQDLQQVSGGKQVTRNYYRANGKYSESEWNQHFPRFEDFLEAAGLLIAEPVINETYEQTDDSMTIERRSTSRITTLDELIEFCKIDTSVWEIDRWICNKWEVGRRDKQVDLSWNDGKADGEVRDSGKIFVEPLFQIKVFLKKKTHVVEARKEIEELKKLAKQYAKLPKPVIRKEAGQNLLEINIPDSHFGKLACALETGYQNCDTKITKFTFMQAFDTLLERTKGYKFKEILFVVGNDLLNSDNAENTTTKGTVVTTDGRYHKTFKTVRDTMIECIEKLRQIAPVRVVMVSGNHDMLSVWHLGDSLECYFHKYEDVVIDNSPLYRKYHQFGKVMLMFTHGDKGKRDEYPLLMATEKPEMFGSTKFRECHTGHTHQTKLNEKYGVRVRVLPALCPPDDWHSENGYVGNLRNAEAYVWNNNEGLIAQVFYSADADESVAEFAK